LCAKAANSPLEEDTWSNRAWILLKKEKFRGKILAQGKPIFIVWNVKRISKTIATDTFKGDHQAFTVS
jgi:hypothetical protein